LGPGKKYICFKGLAPGTLQQVAFCKKNELLLDFMLLEMTIKFFILLNNKNKSQQINQFQCFVLFSENFFCGLRRCD